MTRRQKLITDVLPNCGQLGIGNHVECAAELFLQSRGGKVALAAKIDSNAHPILTLWVFHGCGTSNKQVSLQKKKQMQKRPNTNRHPGDSPPQTELNRVSY